MLASSFSELAAQLARLAGKRIGTLAVIGGATAAAAAFLPRAVFLQAATAASTVGSLVVALRVVAHFRDERPVSRLAQYLAVLVPLATSGVYLLSATAADPEVRKHLAASAIAGLMVGVLWGRATRVYLKAGRPFGRQSGWWLMIWAGTLCVAQAQALFGRTGRLELSLAANAFSTGIAVGTAGAILAALTTLMAGVTAPARPARPSTKTAQRTCPRCKKPTAADGRFCEECGHRW